MHSMTSVTYAPKIILNGNSFSYIGLNIPNMVRLVRLMVGLLIHKNKK